jgi:hypothetical protein
VGAAVSDPDAMDHSITIERVGVAPQWGKFRVRPVAQINAPQILRDLSDHRQVRDIEFVVGRREDATEIRI